MAKAASKTKAPKPATPGVANMGAGAGEENAQQAEPKADAKAKEPSHGDRLDRLEELARLNGWSM